MINHHIKLTRFSLIGLGLGMAIGVIVFTLFISCANTLPTNPLASGWCSDETAELMLPPAFFSTIAFTFLLNTLTGYDLLESNEALFSVIMWMFGVGIYGSVGILIGWIMSKIYIFSKHYAKNQ